jgi:hypothetical protein
MPRAELAGAADRPLGFLKGKRHPRFPLQWIVLFAYRALKAQRASNKPASLLFTTGEQTPFSEALPLPSILSTLPRQVAILQIGRSKGDLLIVRDPRKCGKLRKKP